MLNTIKLISFFSAGGGFLLVGILVIARSGFRSRFSLPLIMACAGTVVWAIGLGSFARVGTAAIALPSLDSLFYQSLFEQLRLLSWIFFLFLILHAELPPKGRVFRPGTLWAIVLGAGVLSTASWYVLSTGSLEAYGRLLTQAAVGAQLLQLVLAVLILENLLRNGDSEWVWSVKHLCLGLGAIFAFDFFMLSETLLLGRLDPNLLTARGFVNLLALPLILISASRAKSWSIDVKVSRRMAFHTASLMATGFYLTLMALTGYFLQQIQAEWSHVLQVVFLAGAFLVFMIVVASGAARANVRIWIAKNFFRYRFDYREVWLRVTDAISRPGPLGLHERIVRAIAELVECTAGALWVHVPEDRAFLPTARWHFGDVETEPLPAIAAADAFVAFLSDSGWVVDLEDLRQETDESQEIPPPPSWLTGHRKARFVVPFFHLEELQAILVIGAPRINQTVEWEARDLLKTAGRQAASYLAEEASANALSDARRLASFHKRSAFIIHDVKNSIGQLELLLANAERYKDRPEFQADMVLTVENTVGQMKKLLQTFKEEREEERQNESFPNSVSSASGRLVQDPGSEPIATVLRRAARQWLPKKDNLEVEIAGHTEIHVDGAKMASVLNHLIHNAVEATHDGGAVGLRLAEEGGRVVLEVRDTGPGMDQAFIETKLFKPLDSGSDGGMGLGAYQTRELVREMGGRLEVDSTLGKGTIMRIALPTPGAQAEPAPLENATP